jgi:hypothetical protein
MALEELLRETLAEDHADPQVVIDPWEIVRLGRRHRRRRITAVLTASVAAVLILGGSAFGWVALRDGSPAQTSAAAGSSGQPEVVVAYEQAQRSWVNCLRSHGADVSMPTEHWPYARLDAQLHQLKGQPVYEAAQEACSTLVPLVTPELERAWGQVP